jgi:class 3 adenylate cyclase
VFHEPRYPRDRPVKRSKAQDLESLTLTEIVRLQSDIAEVMRRRFERSLALCFTDVAGSTAYCARYGDLAGKALSQRHLDLLAPCLDELGGRMIDTAGDSAFFCFEPMRDAALAVSRLLDRLSEANQRYPEEHRLALRTGLHFGPVLTDGTIVSGDAVNVCARVAAIGAPGEIVLTRAAFSELPPEMRHECSPRPSARVKGITEPIETWSMRWRLPTRPNTVVIHETGQRFKLPATKVVTFGRLRTVKDAPGNDIVLELSDPEQTRLISRWHFELHADGDELTLRALTTQTLTVDGKLVIMGTDVPVRAGSVVKVAGVLTLSLSIEDEQNPISQRTLATHPDTRPGKPAQR